jgi:hypothetical protein
MDYRNDEQVSRATAHGGFALKDKNLPPLPSPTHSRRPDHHTSPIRSPTLSPSKSPTIDKGVALNVQDLIKKNILL